MTVEAAEEVRVTTDCLDSPLTAMAVHTPLALRPTQDNTYPWRCLWMNPLGWIQFIRRSSPTVPTSVIVALELIAAAKRKLKMTCTMMVSCERTGSLVGILSPRQDGKSRKWLAGGLRKRQHSQ